ncbi:nucleotide-diphospho-sugar transferase [Lutibacter citreus]|uniref:nucleotide-diphospho-sugar transferase n=1 Tax=Lutibacter citreus TaxID=2138210 RepID=UPI000DBE6BB8|nr:nucleotide-diphospho-sugar transferase [Lutibacter citreus]
MTNSKTPILFLIFRREDVAIESFQSIKKYKPTHLYIAADGPRKHKKEEKELCEKTRNTIINMINWECEVHTLFRDENLGCANAVNGAITWFFKHVEFGVIVEDDCVLHQDFYRLCEELLPLYKNEEQVMQICAHNTNGSEVVSNEYIFAHNAFIWGWATWRRAWNKMDMSMSKWPDYSFRSLIKEYGFFQACFRQYYWNRAYTHLKTLQSWATRWNFSVLSNNGLCISMKANLSMNTGITTEGGTHYDVTSEDPYRNLKYGKMLWPLKHPTNLDISLEKIKVEQKEFKRLKWIGFKGKIGNFIKFKF